ncbi:MAG: tyrosine-protein phosphatase [Clostridiales bacterium]|nr:tyrosine-protein phosphatase [Clostridiales bacterium]
MPTPLRRLPLKALYNTRELGGYPAAGGRVTQYGRLLRSDGPIELPKEDVEALLRYGIRTVVDLRAEDEVVRHPSSLAQAGGIAYHHISLMGDPAHLRKRMDESELNGFMTSLTLLYTSMTDYMPEQFLTIFRLLAQALPQGGVLFNCTAGKDRTGVIAAMVLQLCGVARLDIVADYMVTATYLAPKLMLWAQQSDAEIPKSLLSSEPATIEAFLDHLDRTYGGAERFLIRSGLEPAVIESLREQLLGD